MSFLKTETTFQNNKQINEAVQVSWGRNSIMDKRQFYLKTISSTIFCDEKTRHFSYHEMHFLKSIKNALARTISKKFLFFQNWFDLTIRCSNSKNKNKRLLSSTIMAAKNCLREKLFEIYINWRQKKLESRFWNCNGQRNGYPSFKIQSSAKN